MSRLINDVAKAIASAHGNEFDKLPNYVGGLKVSYLNSSKAAIECIITNYEIELLECDAKHTGIMLDFMIKSLKQHLK